MFQVLDYYESIGFVESVPFSFPGEEPFSSPFHVQMYRDFMSVSEYMPMQHPGRRDCYYRYREAVLMYVVQYSM